MKEKRRDIGKPQDQYAHFSSMTLLAALHEAKRLRKYGEAEEIEREFLARDRVIINKSIHSTASSERLQMNIT